MNRARSGGEDFVKARRESTTAFTRLFGQVDSATSERLETHSDITLRNRRRFTGPGEPAAPHRNSRENRDRSSLRFNDQGMPGAFRAAANRIDFLRVATGGWNVRGIFAAIPAERASAARRDHFANR